MRRSSILFNIYLICFGLFVIHTPCLPQTAKITLHKDTAALEKLGALPKALAEVSGMIPLNDSLLLMHNDSNRGSFIYLVSYNGELKSIKKINHAPNYDWEDITQDKEFIYIGDIGNNKNNRRVLQVYRIKKNDLPTNSGFQSEKIEFSYEDQLKFPPKESNFRFDAEALVCINDTLFIFTKNLTNPFDGNLYVYTVPKAPGNYKASLKYTIFLDGENALNNCITGAAYNEKLDLLALLSYDRVRIISNFTTAKMQDYKVHELKLNHFSQKEAICFDGNNNLLIADEKSNNFLGGYLYRLKLNSKIFK